MADQQITMTAGELGELIQFEVMKALVAAGVNEESG